MAAYHPVNWAFVIKMIGVLRCFFIFCVGLFTKPQWTLQEQQWILINATISNDSDFGFIMVFTRFCGHFTYVESLWKLWNEVWIGPMEMFCSRHIFFFWPYVLCGALQRKFSHKMTLVHLKVPYCRTLTLSSNGSMRIFLLFSSVCNK